MSILERVQSDTIAAMKAGDRPRAQALRLVASELQKARKEAGASEPDDLAVLRRERKRRAEAATAYREAGRTDLADAEEAEAEIIAAYLPAELSDAELEGIVVDALAETGATSPKEMGRVMSVAMARVGGRADGGRVSAAVKERLTI